MNMELHVFAITDRGPEWLDENEDAYVIRTQNAICTGYGDTAKHGVSVKNGPMLVAVFDGLGGEANGGQTAKIAMQTLAESSWQDSLETSIEKTNCVLLEDENLGFTTVAAGLINSEGIATFLNSGDSRMFLLRDGYVEELSKEHTTKKSLMKFGLDEVEAHMFATIDSALGMECVKYHTSYMTFQTGDVVVFLTDGLWELMLPQIQKAAEFQTSLKKATHLHQQINYFLQTKKLNDNGTAIIIYT